MVSRDLTARQLRPGLLVTRFETYNERDIGAAYSANRTFQRVDPPFTITSIETCPGGYLITGKDETGAEEELVMPSYRLVTVRVPKYSRFSSLA